MDGCGFKPNVVSYCAVASVFEKGDNIYRETDEVGAIDEHSVSGFVRVALRPPEGRLVP